LSWSTATFQQNPNANALRWGTLYNFRFDANQPPGTAAAKIGLFRGGLGYSQVVATTLAPHPCAPVASEELGCSDGIDDRLRRSRPTAPILTAALRPAAVSDADGDLVASATATTPNPAVWSTPGEATNLVVAQAGRHGAAHVVAALDRGAAVVAYEALRSTSASDFFPPAVCLALADASQPAATDAQTPAPGGGSTTSCGPRTPARAAPGRVHWGSHPRERSGPAGPVRKAGSPSALSE
jgi:hypothetical protein